jgi:hypothetical protein
MGPLYSKGALCGCRNEVKLFLIHELFLFMHIYENKNFIIGDSYKKKPSTDNAQE